MGIEVGIVGCSLDEPAVVAVVVAAGIVAAAAAAAAAAEFAEVE